MKSRFFGGYIIERSIMGTLRAVCLREHQVSLKDSVKQLLEDRINEYKLGSRFDIKNTHIETDLGGNIIFRGMKNSTADSLKSLEGYDLSWTEEAHSLSADSLKKLRPTLRKKGSEHCFSWNPDSPKDPVDKLLRIDPPPHSIVINVNYWDNPWFPEVLREEMEYDKRRDYEAYENVWEGAYNVKSEARVFKNWRIGSHAEFEHDPEDPLYGGDWGYSKDPNVLVRGYIRGKTLYLDREVWKIGCEIDHTPALWDTLDNKQARKHVIIGDSSRPETISYLRRHGYPKLRAAKKGPNSIVEGVEFVKSYDVVIHPDCTHTSDEFSHYSYKTHSLTGEVLAVLEDKKNHVIDSIRYMLEQLRKPKIGLY